MRRPILVLLALSGVLVVAPAPPASAADRHDKCAQSSWRSRLKSSEEWIIKRESGFSPVAANPTSSAFGIGQLILSNRRRYAAEAGADPSRERYHSGATSPCAQLRMMRLYIYDRYGSTKKAKRFWKRHGWY